MFVCVCEVTSYWNFKHQTVFLFSFLWVQFNPLNCSSLLRSYYILCLLKCEWYYFHCTLTSHKFPQKNTLQIFYLLVNCTNICISLKKIFLCCLHRVLLLFSVVLFLCFFFLFNHEWYFSLGKFNCIFCCGKIEFAFESCNSLHYCKSTLESCIGWWLD